jgi:hypothetical protein
MKKMCASAMVCVPLITAGCALTPAEVIEQGGVSTFVLSGPPAQAADCIARNSENYKPWTAPYTPTVRALSADSMEVIVRLMPADATTIAVAHVTPAPSGGSNARIWKNPNALPIVPDDLPRIIASGC